jgi:hypothetical protein
MPNAGGWQAKPGRRRRVEECFGLDVEQVTRKGSGRVRLAIPLRLDVLEVVYTAHLADPSNPYVAISYQGSAGWTEQTLSLSASAQRLGGARLWFLCPVTGQRVKFVYLPDGEKQFACREAYGLSYRSQSETALFRAITRAQNIRWRLNGSLSIHSPVPSRPPRMHVKTYERLSGRLTSFEPEVAERMNLRVAALERRLSAADAWLQANFKLEEDSNE